MGKEDLEDFKTLVSLAATLVKPAQKSAESEGPRVHDLTAAAKCLVAALDIEGISDKQAAHVSVHLASIYDLLGESVKAREVLAKAQETKPRHALKWLLDDCLISVLLKNGIVDEALSTAVAGAEKAIAQADGAPDDESREKYLQCVCHFFLRASSIKLDTGAVDEALDLLDRAQNEMGTIELALQTEVARLYICIADRRWESAKEVLETLEKRLGRAVKKGADAMMVESQTAYVNLLKAVLHLSLRELNRAAEALREVSFAPSIIDGLGRSGQLFLPLPRCAAYALTARHMLSAQRPGEYSTHIESVVTSSGLLRRSMQDNQDLFLHRELSAWLYWLEFHAVESRILGSLISNKLVSACKDIYSLKAIHERVSTENPKLRMSMAHRIQLLKSKYALATGDGPASIDAAKRALAMLEPIEEGPEKLEASAYCFMQIGSAILQYMYIPTFLTNEKPNAVECARIATEGDTGVLTQQVDEVLCKYINQNKTDYMMVAFQKIFHCHVSQAKVLLEKKTTSIKEDLRDGLVLAEMCDQPELLLLSLEATSIFLHRRSEKRPDKRGQAEQTLSQAAKVCIESLQGNFMWSDRIERLCDLFGTSISCDGFVDSPGHQPYRQRLNDLVEEVAKKHWQHGEIMREIAAGAAGR